MADENMNETSVPSDSPSGDSKDKMNPTMMIVVILAVIVVIAGLFFFMGGRNKVGEESMTPVVGKTPAAGVGESTDGAMTESADVLTVKMEAGSFYYKPNVINAKLGQTVRVELSAVSLQHDFNIDDLGVKSAIIPSGKSTTVEFTADTLGEFEFYCSVGNHRQQGMVGTLNVTN